MLVKNTIYKLLVNYITENQNKFYRVAYSYCKSSDDALDIVQQSIYKSLKSYKSIKSPQYIQTWFFRILINTSITHINRNKSEIINNINLSRCVESSTYDKSYIDLYNALDCLEDIEKVIIILKFFENLTFEEISTILNINISTVKSKCYKTLKLLKIKLH